MSAMWYAYAQPNVTPDVVTFEALSLRPHAIRRYFFTATVLGNTKDNYGMSDGSSHIQTYLTILNTKSKQLGYT
jgi:hypothetical protein